MKFLAIIGLILSKVALLKVIWKRWDIQTFLISSFVFQLILILYAPFRKRSGSLITRFILWFSYLLADWVAAQAIGLITRATEPGSCRSVSDSEAYLFAFWAQFLLVHLGGPDTITALALEDNELWLRTGMHLGTQTFTTLGVLLRSTRRSGLWAATFMMFLVGIIKYLERVMSLFHGRLMDGINEDPRHYAKKLMANQSDDDQSKDTDMEGQTIRRVDDPLTNVEMVRDAFNLFHCHKRLFIDRKLWDQIRKSTQEYFRRRSAEEAYKLVEIELNFTYEAIYTKMKVIQKPAWRILRHIVLSMEVGGLVIWCFTEKRGYTDNDIRITNVLAVGAIAVDVLAFLRIQLSDWNIARISIDGEKEAMWANWRINLHNKLLAARTRSWKKAEAKDSSAASSILIILRSWFSRLFLRRWSESIHQIYFDDLETREYVLDKAPSITKSVLITGLFVKKKGVSREMWELIYEEVMRKLDKSPSVLVMETKRYKKRVANGKELVDLHSLVDTAFPTHSLEKDYVNCFESWANLTDELLGEEDISAREESNLVISVTLMNYFVYLHLAQPDMMYGAAGKEILQSALDNAFGTSKMDVRSSDDDDDKEDRPQEVENIGDLKLVDQMEKIYDLNKMLDEIEYEDENEREILKWELIAWGWVKLICHAAIKCRPDIHAKKLKEGGEFLTFVWLLMVNLNVTQV